MKTDWFLGAALGVLHSLAVRATNERVPDPYMDETFHVAQARLYCAGTFDKWDPKITTPPLLYTLVLLLQQCGSERFVNSILVPISFVCLCRLRRHFLRQQNDAKTDCVATDHRLDVYLSALTVLCLPVLLDTSLLFYTDLLSLALLALGLSFSDRPFPMFFVFALSLFVRQTNIVWLFFSAFPTLCLSLRTLCQRKISLYETVIFLFRRLWPHAVLCLAFLVFLCLNEGSVVLGDRSAHHPVLHFPQMLYFCAFVAASALPNFAFYLFRRICEAKRRGFFVSRPFVFAVLFAMCSFVAVVHLFTMAHPYLLADNRHFTFYIWQRIFQRHSLVRYALVPIYTICAIFMWDSMESDAMTKIGFVVSTAACLVPAHLLEFRYFIVPYTVWRLLNRAALPRWILYAELALHLVINAVALHLFFNFPFRWESEPGKLQRFMW